MANGNERVTVKNVIFDIGNVLVRWDPHLIVERTFGKGRTDEALVRSIFPGNDIWIPLNKGEITAQEAMLLYQEQLGFTAQETKQLWFHILDSQEPIPGTIDLMKQLREKDIQIFALSDNVHEIVSHLKEEHDFWHFFKGAVISAEVGLLKPDPEIYQHLLSKHQIEAKNTLFMDDVQANVDEANSLGINAFVFSTAEKAKSDMRQFDIILS